MEAAWQPSPIDVRLDQSLGHFVKLFKNGTQLSVKTLGPMYGQWGSFLPAEIRLPSILVSDKAVVPTLETHYQKNVSKKDSILAPKRENAVKLNRENVQDCTNPHPDLKNNSENRSQFQNVSKKDSILAPKRENAVKPNRENVQDCTNPHPDLKNNSENRSICDNQSKCAVMFCKRKGEDKEVGPSPKKRNLGVYSFSRLHTILPCLSPPPVDTCVNSKTLDPNEKRANITPNTPIDNKEQTVQFVRTDNTFALQEVQGQLRQAMEIHKEAQDLEHRASRLKKCGQDGLGAEIYLESAIKYLHAAHILEPANWEKIKLGDADQSMRLYIRAGKLFEYVARIFHEWMQFVPAGLAYKANLTPFSNIPPSLPRFLDYVSVMNSAFEGTNGCEKVLRDAANCAHDISLLKEALNLNFHHVELVLLTVRRALASSYYDRWSS